MTLFSDFGSEPFLGGTLTFLDPGISDAAGEAVALQISAALRESFNLLAETGNLSAAEQLAFNVLQQPALSFARFINPESLALGSFQPIATGEVFQPGLSIDLLALSLLNQQFGQAFPGTAPAGVVGATAGILEPALQRRALAERFGPRNPFLSLQAGPFVPCSSDDPRGRCLTPGARDLQNRAVQRTAGGE